MLRVTIELVPGGDESRKRVIGTGEIINNGTGNVEFGNYETWFVSHRSGDVDPEDLKARINGFARCLGPWTLLAVALDRALEEATS